MRARKVPGRDRLSEAGERRPEAESSKEARGGSAAGHGPVVEDDPDSSSLLLAVKRARTLALFLLLLSCTTAILEGYEETLAAHVSLSFFVPFLIGHGGNCGGMSVGAVISAIARRRAHAIF